MRATGRLMNGLADATPPREPLRVWRNGMQSDDLTDTDPARGLRDGHLAPHNHGADDRVPLCDVRIKELPVRTAGRSTAADPARRR